MAPDGILAETEQSDHGVRPAQSQRVDACLTQQNLATEEPGAPVERFVARMRGTVAAERSRGTSALDLDVLLSHSAAPSQPLPHGQSLDRERGKLCGGRILKECLNPSSFGSPGSGR